MCVTVGLDLLQIWVAPNQHFCFVKNFFKSPVLVMIALSLCFTTILKFYVLATKSIPEMDEFRVAKKENSKSADEEGKSQMNKRSGFARSA